MTSYNKDLLYTLIRVSPEAFANEEGSVSMGAPQAEKRKQA